MVNVEEQPADESALWPQISASPGFAEWLAINQVSIACTSYQTGQLFLIGVNPGGGANVDQHSFNHAMGLCFDDNRLWLGSLTQVWRLENVLAPDERFNGIFDRVFVPRVGHTTGNIDIHEIGVIEGEPVFVNTQFSCVAKLDERHSFRPIWKPSFISELTAHDRCHLNGMCIVDGELRYVTAAGRSDEPQGWRKKRAHGGIIIDVQTDEIIAEKLSMPHSPRLHEGRLFALDSGRGWLVEIDPKTGRRREVAFGHGFLRGLALTGQYAVVGSSKPRDKAFKGLPLEAALKKRKLDPRCGIFIFDLATGANVEWLSFDTKIMETFDVEILPNVGCPMSIGISAPDIANQLSFPLLPGGASGDSGSRVIHYRAVPSDSKDKTGSLGIQPPEVRH